LHKICAKELLNAMPGTRAAPEGPLEPAGAQVQNNLDSLSSTPRIAS
jgi:hypothetical protein